MFRTKKYKATDFERNYTDVGIFVTNPEHRLQLCIIELEDQDLQKIRSLQPYVEQHIKPIVDNFYKAIEQVPHLKAIIADNSTTTRLRQTLTTHVQQMFSGKIDDAFINVRQKVGRVHVRIGLYPKWYLAAFQRLEKDVRRVILQLDERIEIKLALIESLGKICNFEQQLVLEEYDKFSTIIVQEKQEEINRRVREELGSVSGHLELQSRSTAQAVAELIQSTVEVEHNLKISMEEATETKKASEKGCKQMQALNEQTGMIHNKTLEMSHMVQELNGSSNEIKNVIEIVKTIANQTNLLALNSAIEAARAGAHGKGFAVVADEVRKLADETKASVEQIASLIEESNAVTNDVVAAIEQIQSLMHIGKKENEKLMVAFEGISTNVESTINDFQSVSQQISTLSTVIATMGSSSEQLEESASILDQTIQNF